LPGLLFHDPKQMLPLVSETEPLLALWKWLAGELGSSSGMVVEPTGLTGEVFAVDDVGPMAVITFPAPACPPEAYFAAAVCLVDGDGVSGQKATVRYLTLERTVETPESAGTEPTVMGEWTAEGTHINYGAGPRPTRDAFIEAVRSLVLRLPPYDGPPEASTTALLG
jgi:hypothetical protein